MLVKRGATSTWQCEEALPLMRVWEPSPRTHSRLAGVSTWVWRLQSFCKDTVE